MEISYSVEDFECPCCCGYVTQPILMCKNRHLICENCCRKIRKCPLCRVQYLKPYYFDDNDDDDNDDDHDHDHDDIMTGLETRDGPREVNYLIRDTKLEQLVATKKWNCTHEKNGCRTLMRLADKENHEISCPYQLMKCPLASRHGCARHDHKYLVLQHCCYDHGMRLNAGTSFVRHVTGDRDAVEETGSFDEMLVFAGGSVFVTGVWSIEQTDSDGCGDDAFGQAEAMCYFRFFAWKLSKDEFEMKVEITHGRRKIKTHVSVRDYRLEKDAATRSVLNIKFEYDKHWQVFESKFRISCTTSVKTLAN